MRKVLIATALLFVVALSGCSQEKAKVTAYLEALEASNAKMKGIAQEMQTSMSGLQSEIQSGKFDPEAAKAKLSGFSDQMKAEKTSVEALEVPEKAKALHEVILKQYQTAIDVLAETGPMMDLAKEMTDVTTKIKADPSKAKAAMAEMKTATDKIQVAQGKIVELAQKAQEYETQARAEQKKLADEFGIQIKGETAEGGEATESAPTEKPEDTK